MNVNEFYGTLCHKDWFSPARQLNKQANKNPMDLHSRKNDI